MEMTILTAAIITDFRPLVKGKCVQRLRNIGQNGEENKCLVRSNSAEWSISDSNRRLQHCHAGVYAHSTMETKVKAMDCIEKYL